MGDAAEVCALATAVLARSRPVHVLIHSAGGVPPAAARTSLPGALCWRVDEGGKQQ